MTNLQTFAAGMLFAPFAGRTRAEEPFDNRNLQLWTPAQAWNTAHHHLAFQTEAEMLHLLQGLVIQEFEPAAGARKTRKGVVFWSAYNIIGVKPESNAPPAPRT